MIHRDEIDEELKNLAFNFFYWFSRFEFALKENGCVIAGHRNIAQADWGRFVRDCEAHYQPDGIAQELLDKPPDVQVVKNANAWKWAPLTIDQEQSELSKVVLLVKMIRNNLFHGGKHNAAGWDDPERVKFLLNHGIKLLDSFAHIARYDADYKRFY